ncbi:CAMK family protein kinase [Tritrichomonas foetus]|uniref:CAMK family protein kinase n=1 Tax=Tritrichomonas foetus TaxID=1144522 RepID=A0A1J4KPP9_9EUKA|nr:CAMK family protein kinase [Tritrichomonas foetus]|eukprot:OHT13281.1 CAMK family protein kinase [Tritrichomonas foetus]
MYHQRSALREINANEQNSWRSNIISKIEGDYSLNQMPSTKFHSKKESQFIHNRDSKIIYDQETIRQRSIHNSNISFYMMKKPQRCVSSKEPQNYVNSSTSSSPTYSYEEDEIFNESKIIRVNEHPYLILQKIGKGGSSKVYKVLAPDGNTYALKIVDLSQASQEAIESFVNEIHLLKVLQGSDRIIQLIDSQVDMYDKRISIVLELGDIDLRSLIEKNRTEDQMVNPNFLRLCWQQMLEAVQIVHKNNVVHGDLKPANFLFVKGTLKLIDFGIAKSIDIDADTTNIERTKQVGTLNYMSPEALKKNENKGTFKCGRAADVWSLGCILYQLVYNQPPFPQNDLVSKIQAIVNPDYEIEFPFIEDRPDFPDLLDVMSSCLERDPKERPRIEDLLDHKYITAQFSDLEEQVSQKLLSFINFIQDYEYAVGENADDDDYIMDRFGCIILDKKLDHHDMDAEAIRIGEMLNGQ